LFWASAASPLKTHSATQALPELMSSRLEIPPGPRAFITDSFSATFAVVFGVILLQVSRLDKVANNKDSLTVDERESFAQGNKADTYPFKTAALVWLSRFSLLNC
jgi:hypothetical protein